MSAAIHQIPETAPSRAGNAADLNHEICCVDQDLAMCGTDITGADWTALDPLTCVVCADLLEQWAQHADRFGDDLEKPGARSCRFCPKRTGVSS